MKWCILKEEIASSFFKNRRKIKEKSALFGGPYRNSDRQFFYSPIKRAWAISTGFFLDFCAKVKEETGAYSAGPHYGRIKKLPVRISVGTAKQCRLLFNFSSIFKGKKQQFDAICSDFAIFETNLFRKFSSMCWFFVAAAGKISSSCSQSRRKS